MPKVKANYEKKVRARACGGNMPDALKPAARNLHLKALNPFIPKSYNACVDQP